MGRPSAGRGIGLPWAGRGSVVIVRRSEAVGYPAPPGPESEDRVGVPGHLRIPSFSVTER